MRAYLEGRIGFYGITALIEKCLDGATFAANPSAGDIFATHEETLRRAQELL